MSLFDSLGDLLKRVTTGDAPAADVHATYDQVAGAVPRQMFAEGLSHTFRSDETPPFEQMVSGLFERSTPEQKGGFVNHLLGVLGPAGFAQALSAAGLGTGPQPVQTGGSLTPHQARQLAPESVQVLARQAVKRS